MRIYWALEVCIISQVLKTAKQVPSKEHRTPFCADCQRRSELLTSFFGGGGIFVLAITTLPHAFS